MAGQVAQSVVAVAHGLGMDDSFLLPNALGDDGEAVRDAFLPGIAAAGAEHEREGVDRDQERWSAMRHAPSRPRPAPVTR